MPTPVVNKVIVVKETKGTVKVKLPGTKTFVDLDATRGIPIGSEVDTRKGVVELTSVPTAGRNTADRALLRRAVQGHAVRGITNLTLTEKLARLPEARARRRGGEEAQEAQALG